MLHLFMASGPWFRTRRYGYGAGLPIRWQGWALLVFYLLALAGIGMLSEAHNAPARITAFALFLVITVLFIIVLQRRTEGEWKWRWGGKV